MKRFLLVFGLTMMACSALNRLAEGAVSTPARGEESAAAESDVAPAPSERPAESEPTERAEPSPTVYSGAPYSIPVSPVCTIVGEPDTQTEKYGNSFEMNWGWFAKTEQQVQDYLDSAVTRVTFHGEEVTDAAQTDVYFADDVYNVFWYKSLGVLERGKYTMTFFEKYEKKIFDGWEYFGPGTDHESTEATCYLIVE